MVRSVATRVNNAENKLKCSVNYCDTKKLTNYQNFLKSIPKSSKYKSKNLNNKLLISNVIFDRIQPIQ